MLTLQSRHTRITNKGSNSENNGKKCGHLRSTQIVYEHMYYTCMYACVFVRACVFAYFHFPYDGPFWAKKKNIEIKAAQLCLVRGVAQGEERACVCVCVCCTLRLKSGTRVLAHSELTTKTERPPAKLAFCSLTAAMSLAHTGNTRDVCPLSQPASLSRHTHSLSLSSTLWRPVLAHSLRPALVFARTGSRSPALLLSRSSALVLRPYDIFVLFIYYGIFCCCSFAYK